MLYLFTEDLFNENGEIRFENIKLHAKPYMLKDLIWVVLSAKNRILIDEFRLEIARCGVLLSSGNLYDFCKKLTKKDCVFKIDMEVTEEYIILKEDRTLPQFNKDLNSFNDIWSRAKTPEMDILRKIISERVNKLD